MPEINFYLKNPNEKKKKQLIYMFFSFGSNKRLKYSTRRHIIPSAWNDTSQKPRSDADLSDYLKKIARDIEKIELNLRTSGVNITTELLRQKLDEALDNNLLVKHNLFSFVEEYISQIHAIKKESTLKGYRNTLRHLREYQSFKRKKIDFIDINQEFYDDFNKYLVIQKSFSVNTIGKQIKNIKVFMSEATEKGLNTNLDYKSRKFKVISEQSDSVYLNNEEINKLFELDLSDNLRLERVRDLFVVGCNTGLRFSDFSNIKPENIKGTNISLKTIKMNQSVVIPINKMVSVIMKKYRKEYANCLPPALSNQKMNDYIKEICKLAGFTEQIETSHYIGSKRHTEIYPKYELVTTHTARRSFATNLFLNGVETKIIRDITGHKTEKAFFTYIKSTPEQQANKLQGFYNENGL
jgi:site-specific recombinase XerD